MMYQLWNYTKVSQGCRFDLKYIFFSAYSMLMGAMLVTFSCIPPDSAMCFSLEQAMLVLHCAAGS